MFRMVSLERHCICIEFAAECDREACVQPPSLNTLQFRLGQTSLNVGRLGWMMFICLMLQINPGTFWHSQDYLLTGHHSQSRSDSFISAQNPALMPKRTPRQASPSKQNSRTSQQPTKQRIHFDNRSGRAIGRCTINNRTT